MSTTTANILQIIAIAMLVAGFVGIISEPVPGSSMDCLSAIIIEKMFSVGLLLGGYMIIKKTLK